MKSRYCAFVRGEIDYIVKTTHPKNPALQGDVSKWRRELQEFSKNTQFKGLKILEVHEAEAKDKADADEKATVTFCVDLIQHGRQAGFTEKSTFEKVNGRWLYLDGVIQSLEEAVLPVESDFSL